MACSSVGYGGNQTDAYGDQKCPWCPLSGDVDADYVGIECLYGDVQQTICGCVMDGDDFAIFRVKNVAAYSTVVGPDPIYQSYYVDGDAEAHDSGVGPDEGDPDYTGPYE